MEKRNLESEMKNERLIWFFDTSENWKLEKWKVKTTNNVHTNRSEIVIICESPENTCIY